MTLFVDGDAAKTVDQSPAYPMQPRSASPSSAGVKASTPGRSTRSRS